MTEQQKNSIVGEVLCLEKYRFADSRLVADVARETLRLAEVLENPAIPYGSDLPCKLCGKKKLIHQQYVDDVGGWNGKYMCTACGAIYGATE